MKKKNIIIIGVVAIIGIIAIIAAAKGSRNATIKQDYQVEDTASVTRIFMVDKMNQKVDLSLSHEGVWMVDGTWEANRPMVEILLGTLHDIRMRQMVNHAAIPAVVSDMAAQSVKVEVYQRKPFINWFGGKFSLFPREKRTVTYYIGRETPDQMGSYLLREGDKVPCVIHIPGFRGFVTPRFVAEPIKWRSHLITDLNVDGIQSVELQIPSMPEESFSIVRKDEGFDMILTASGNAVPVFDTARVARLLSSFTWLNFDEFASIVPGSFADSCVSTEPRTILLVTDTAGNQHEVRSFIKYTNPNDLSLVRDPSIYSMFDVDRLYAIIDHRDTVLIQFFAFDNILQPASYFLGGDVSIPMQ